MPKIIQSTSWSKDGNKIAVSSKDTKVRIFDVRTNAIEKETQSHQSIRGSRILYVNNDYVLTTGRSLMFSFFSQNMIKLTQDLS